MGQYMSGISGSASSSSILIKFGEIIVTYQRHWEFEGFSKLFKIAGVTSH